MLIAIFVVSGCSDGKSRADENIDADFDDYDLEFVEEESYECQPGETRFIECETDSEKFQKEKCENGYWKTLGECLKCGGMFPNEFDERCWSDRSEDEMTFYNARFYCDKIGGIMPDIDLLRTLIKNCPKTETDGECLVFKSCSSKSKCWNENCLSCETAMDGSHSVLGQTGIGWSATVDFDNMYYAWSISFFGGRIESYYTHEKHYVWCVRSSL